MTLTTSYQRRNNEPIPIRNCEYDEEAIASTEVLLSHGWEFFLTRGIQDWKRGLGRGWERGKDTFQLAQIIINEALFCVRIFDGWIIVSDEVLLKMDTITYFRWLL